MKGKKASFQMVLTAGAYIRRLVYLIFIVLTIAWLAKYFIFVNIDVSEAEAKILINRFVYSPQCIAYTDNDIFRPYPGVVDLQRFNQEVLGSCVYYGEQNDYAAAKLVLHLLDTGEDIQVMYNKGGYDVWLPLVGISRGPELFQDSKYVLVMDEGNLRRAVLDTDVIIPSQ